MLEHLVAHLTNSYLVLLHLQQLTFISQVEEKFLKNLGLSYLNYFFVKVASEVH